jgi:hypothetical protein
LKTRRASIALTSSDSGKPACRKSSNRLNIKHIAHCLRFAACGCLPHRAHIPSACRPARCATQYAFWRS